MPPALATRRLLLEPMSVAEHADEVLALYDDPRFAEYLASGRARTRDDIERVLAPFHALPDRLGGWLARRRDDPAGRAIGRFSLRPWTHADVGDPLEVGWFLAPAQWGQGLAGEAVRAVLRYAWADLGESAVIALVRHDNAASRRLAERLGGRVVGQGSWYGPEPSLRYHLDLPVLTELAEPAAKTERAAVWAQRVHALWCAANEARCPDRAPWRTTLDQVRTRLDGAACVMLAHVGSELVGCAVLAPTDDDSPVDAFVSLVAVAPAYQGWGIASALVCQVLARADTLGFRRVELLVAHDNRTGIGLYRRHGFAETGEERLAPAGEHCVVMVRQSRTGS